MNLKYMIEKYVPFNEQEVRDKEVMLEYLNNFDDVLTRNNTIGHFSASAWAVNKERNKALMIYHNIYDSWTWTGGHSDGEEDLLGVAVRELKEETGVTNINVVDSNIFSLEAIPVMGHIKRGKYVSSHMHLNLTYLIEVDESDRLEIKEDENAGVKWVPFDEINQTSSEIWMNENIFDKLRMKLESLNK